MGKVRKYLIMILVSGVIASVLMTAASAGDLMCGTATVSASSLNIRSGPGTSYSILGEAGRGSEVVVLSGTNGGWYYINSGGTKGYVDSTYLTQVQTPKNSDKTGSVTGDSVRLRSEPSISGGIIETCSYGSQVTITGFSDGWYQVSLNGKAGFIKSDYIKLSSDTADGASSVTEIRREITDFALQYVGYNYVYGGSSPSTGFDCSGFTYYIFTHFGYSITRTASSQYKNNGVKVSKSELQPGDLIFFSSDGHNSVTHVGLYIGDDKFVHASTPKNGVLVSSLDTDYYINAWYGAKRMIS